MLPGFRYRDGLQQLGISKETPVPGRKARRVNTLLLLSKKKWHNR
jgi:hypothetical protein